jgi:hypothetical protein
MLALPANWKTCSTGYVVRDLLRQADYAGLYAEAARAMTRASIDFMLSGPRWTGRVECLSSMTNPLAWRINDWVFYVLPRLDDNALNELAKLVQSRCNVDLIVPPWAEHVARFAVASISRRMNVFSIDTYIDLRILWTSLEMEKRHSEALMELLQHYDSLVKAIPILSIGQIHAG